MGQPNRAIFKAKFILVKYDIPRNIALLVYPIITYVSFVVSSIPKEDG